MHLSRSALLGALLLAVNVVPATLSAQVPVGPEPPAIKTGGSKNIKMLGHVPQGGFGSTADVRMEQEMSRPYVYVSGFIQSFFNIVSVKDPSNPQTLLHWQIENAALHRGLGFLRGVPFKVKGRYYYAQCMQYEQGGTDSDLGLIIFDITGLPNASLVKEVARVRYPKALGGFHDVVAYKHSDGRVLLFTTVVGPYANIWDAEKIVTGAPPDTWKIGEVPIPGTTSSTVGGNYHDFYIGYDPAVSKDKFYGAGLGGYYVFDVTKPETPALMFSITGASGIARGHTFTPTPDGKFAVAEAEYQFAPLRIFDLRPALEGKTQNINRPIAGWTADWQDLPHNHEVRWPYVFVSAYEDGLQVFNMIDPKHPKTVGWFYTCECEHENGFGGVTPPYRGPSVDNGAFGVDVRNADGLVVISDMETGLWVFKMDGFNSWNGNDWNMPNISSAQDWDNGPIKQAGMKTKPVT
jgi:hypothetical protein